MSHACDGRDLSCPACAEMRRRLDTVRVAMTTDDQLDDIKRARIWTQIEDRLAHQAPTRRARWPFALGAAAAAAAVIGFAARGPGRAEPHTLAVPVDTTVTSQLGPYTAASIVGPAQLDLLGPTGNATVVRVHRGTLLAEFTGGAGRSLRIVAPGAVIEVVGTLFAVEVRGETTCTSVSHGRVRVTTARGAIEVSDGQRHCVGDAVRPISDDIREALERHGAALAARTEGSPSKRAATPALAEPTRSGSDATPAAGDASAGQLSGTSDPRAVAAQPAAGSIASDPRAVAAQPGAKSIAPAPLDTRERRSAPATSVGEPAVDRAVAPSNLDRRASAGSPRASVAAAGGPVVGRPTPTPASASPRRTAAPSSPAPVPTTDPARSPLPPRAPGLAQREPAPDAPGPAPAAPAAPGPAPAAPARPTADELYHIAENSLAVRNLAAADRALAALITEYPASQLVDQALYERARIAYQQRAWPAARVHLVRLAKLPGSRLAEPGHYLRCRIALEAHEPGAAACLTDYRAAFPRSPHDLDALGRLAQLAHAAGGCTGAAKLVDELVQLYPRTTLAAAWSTRCPEPR